MRRESLLWDLDEYGLDFIIEVYTTTEARKTFYHTKAKAERDESRSRNSLSRKN